MAQTEEKFHKLKYPGAVDAERHVQLLCLREEDVVIIVAVRLAAGGELPPIRLCARP